MKDPLKQFSARLKVDAFISTNEPDYETCFCQAKARAIQDLKDSLQFVEEMDIDYFTEANPRIKEFYDAKQK